MSTILNEVRNIMSNMETRLKADLEDIRKNVIRVQSEIRNEDRNYI